MDTFKRKCKKFVSILPSNELRFKKTGVLFLRFFTREEIIFRDEFILLQHNLNGHAGRDGLFSLLQTLAYGITRVLVQSIISQCSVYQARRTLVIRPVITPIIAQFYRKRFIADFADLRYYSN